MEKRCRECLATKPLGDFYKHPGMRDGHLNYCKACKRVEVAKRRFDNPELFAKRDRARYRASPVRRKQCNDAATFQRINNRLKREARIAVGNAIRNRRLKRMPCAVCGSEKVEAHHDDYSKPLEVHWLCRKHHMERHRKYQFEKAA